MSPVSNFHGEAAQRIFYPGFDGGLNLAVPSESMSKNELKEALNVEFSHLTGAMRVRGGLVWSGRFKNAIDCVVPVRGRRGFLVRRKGTEDEKTKEVYYFRWNNIWPVTGELTGTGELSEAAWGEPGEVLIASGGKLQLFSDVKMPPRLKTLENSPDKCRLVFVRDGRVGVISGDNTIHFSAIGDCTQWENNPEDDSSGQFLDIGYKDAMIINALVPLSRDLIIFKSPPDETDKGTVWRLTGEYPNWQVLEAAHNTGTFSNRSVQAVGNDVFYITNSGLATLSSVTSYGDIQTSWPDRKVSSALTPKISSSARLWDVPVKQQLWLLPSQTESDIWVFDYQRGIWTKFRFPELPIYAAGIDERLYLFIGQDIYEVNDYYTQDDMKDTGKHIIEANMKLGTILTGHQTLIKGAFVSFDLSPSCHAELLLGKFRMPFTIAGNIDYIYDTPNDIQCIYNDYDPLFPEGQVLTSRRQCIVRDWQITPEIKITGGGCSISTMGLEMVEV